MKKVFLILLCLFLFSSCSKDYVEHEEEIVEYKAKYEEVEHMDEEEFDRLYSYIEDNIRVFDIEEVHNVLFEDLRKEIDISSKTLDEDLRLIIEPFFNEWKRKKIESILIEKNIVYSAEDIQKYYDAINIDDVLDFIIVYEKNALKMKNR